MSSVPNFLWNNGCSKFIILITSSSPLEKINSFSGSLSKLAKLIFSSKDQIQQLLSDYKDDMPLLSESNFKIW